jgi:caffeoyl-CoA O-methyltransferase
MTSRAPSPWLDAAVAQYIGERLPQPDQIQQDLMAVTAEKTGRRAGMQIGPDQGALMELLVRLVGAKRIVEIGTFTGYSALCLARAAGPDGRLTCCDISEEWTSIGRSFWERAGVADRIDLRIAPAIETVRSLPKDDVIDLAFIDADKTGYAAYLEELIPRLRRGGLILVDNTLWGGRVVQTAAEDDADTKALKAFNDAVAADDRLESFILPIGDGLTLIRVR